MCPFELHTVDTAHWHALLTAAEAQTDRCLAADLEGYLVITLLRYAQMRNSGTPRPAATDTLNPAWQAQLREVGDKCLIFAGLMPDQARRLEMSIGYLVELGRKAYRELADRTRNPVFQRLSEGFVELMDVLQAMRELDDSHRAVDLLGLYEQWHETGSQHAYRALCAATGALPGHGAARIH